MRGISARSLVIGQIVIGAACSSPPPASPPSPSPTADANPAEVSGQRDTAGPDRPDAEAAAGPGTGGDSRIDGDGPGAVAFAWPGGARAAVSLTYDDGITTHVDIVGPDLAARRLRGTFFISDQANLVRPAGATRQKWIALHQGGHEFASHTINHPCSQTMAWVPPQFALEVYTLERMGRELDDSIALVGTLASGTPPTVFAYPCASDWVGNPPQSYAALVKTRFRAARGGKPGVADPATVDLHDVSTFGPEGTSAADLVQWVDRAVAQGGWLVFTFHGVGGDYITVTREAHAALLMALDTRRTEVWTERFGTVADYVASHR